MGRPVPLESRFGGPWYREVKDLPTKGTAPKSALTAQIAGFVPSLCPLRYTDMIARTKAPDKTLTNTDDHTISQHKAPSSQTQTRDTETRKSDFPGAPTWRGTGTGPLSKGGFSNNRFVPKPDVAIANEVSTLSKNSLAITDFHAKKTQHVQLFENPLPGTPPFGF